MKPQDAMTIQEACRRYTVSRSTIIRAIRDGAPSIKAREAGEYRTLLDRKAFRTWVLRHRPHWQERGWKKKAKTRRDGNLRGWRTRRKLDLEEFAT